MEMIKASQAFFKESWQELKKVTAPGRKEIFASTLVVVVVTVLFMALTLIEDQVIGWLIGLFYN